MGNCGCKNNDDFIQSNIIDPKNNIVVGIYNSDQNQICEGIKIGTNGQINKLLFVSSHKQFNMAILNFKNNIMLKIFIDPDDSKIKYKLVCGNENITNPIEPSVLNKIKYIHMPEPSIDPAILIRSITKINIIADFIEQSRNHIITKSRFDSNQ